MHFAIVLEGAEYFNNGLRVAIAYLLLGIKEAFRSFINLEGVQSCLFEFYFEVHSFYVWIFGSLVDIGGIVVDLCNCNGSILQQEVLEFDIEDPISQSRLEFYAILLFFRNFLPSWIFVAPITYAFLLAPRIP